MFMKRIMRSVSNLKQMIFNIKFRLIHVIIFPEDDYFFHLGSNYFSTNSIKRLKPFKVLKRFGPNVYLEENSKVQ